MCWGLMLRQDSEFQPQIWKGDFIYLIVARFIFQILFVSFLFWFHYSLSLSLVTLPPPILFTRPSIYFHSSCFLVLPFHLSSTLLSLGSSSPVHLPSWPPFSWPSPLSHWHHTLLPSPENHFKRPASSKPHSQPASQPVSQPASLLLRLKITVVPVARLLSSSDTHQRSS